MYGLTNIFPKIFASSTVSQRLVVSPNQVDILLLFQPDVSSVEPPQHNATMQPTVLLKRFVSFLQLILQTPRKVKMKARKIHLSMPVLQYACFCSSIDVGSGMPLVKGPWSNEEDTVRS